MRLQIQRRDSKNFLVVDEDCGISASLVESYRAYNEKGPSAQSDPREYLLSMSEYDKAQAYDVYDYPTAPPRQQGQHTYGDFAAHPTYTGDYVAAQAQVPSGLPQSSTHLALVQAVQQYGTHDPTYYGQQVSQYPAYLEPPRPLPAISHYAPHGGQQGTTVTVHFQSVYDFDAPQIAPIIMFGSKRCQSILQKSPPQGNAFQYTLTADAPSMNEIDSPSPVVPLHLVLNDGSVTWESPSVEFGEFTYQPDPPTYYQLDSPQMPAQQLQAPRKRKLSTEASPRRSPTKKASMYNLGGQQSGYDAIGAASSFRRPSVPDIIYDDRRFSSDYQSTYGGAISRAPSTQYYGSVGHPTPSLQTSHSPSWSYPHSMQGPTRSPSAAMSTISRSSQLLPSPAPGHPPPLIRTSTLHHSPTTPGAAMTTVATGFNPYTIYPANTKAMLKIDGDLNAMADKWTEAEWESKRRLVQFRRSQTGSVISATFEPVTLEDRIPNSICVSCIWWEEKQECYVTSVDTISLLESLVAVRFTVEEKNRIRRNLEGFRPATVSKTKQDSEEFFKLIMGFPNPKPRNIEKDVKVFPWRILATALKKIIGKYSASYSSTAAALHTPSASGYATTRASDAGIDHRMAASPRSTSSSVGSHSHAYAPPPMPHNVFTSHGIGPPTGQSDMRLAVPTSAGAQTTSWHQPSSQYSSDLAGRAWDFSAGYLSAPATGLPGSAHGLPGTAQSYPYQQRVPSLTGPSAMPSEARFVPLHDYERASHPTSTS
ncbi:hypothetical protein DOTSEDRAFT_69633 [Dothistroma septosporum NZE10]|uniref:DUF7082 domain-containing protein n=1 Tax=Dothistroma septosporum (strain NZE10 / CBS 128990) TaxID=675120 RepID=N1PXN1_DOTSN|nr:hypothetical protein DOTSEDRAFT_69633 [Dothistroma septosporum NZE10]